MDRRRVGVPITTYSQYVMGWTTESQFDIWQWKETFLHSNQTGSGVHTVSHIMAIGALTTDLKRSRRKADHLPQSNTQVMNVWAIPSVHNTS
jgi:hypothetical protein